MKLTARQTELIHLLIAGLQDKAIAARPGICYGTVRKHFELLFRKFGVPTRVVAAIIGAELQGSSISRERSWEGLDAGERFAIDLYGSLLIDRAARTEHERRGTLYFAFKIGVRCLQTLIRYVDRVAQVRQSRAELK